MPSATLSLETALWLHGECNFFEPPDVHMDEQAKMDLENELKRLVMETREGNKASYTELLNRLSPLLKKAAKNIMAGRHPWFSY